MADSFGRAIRDHFLGEREEPLIGRDGGDRRKHSIEDYYFGDHEENIWRDAWIDGPLTDLGAGAGRDSLYYQNHFETVAIEASEYRVKTMRDYGVNDVRLADMFSIRNYFDRNLFHSVHLIGTQIGLAGLLSGVREFLDGLAYVTMPDATALIDNYAPEKEATRNVFVYREDSIPGPAYRIFHCEYEGDVGRTLLFVCLA